MEEFFQAIEKHKDTAACIGVFIWVCCSLIKSDCKCNSK